jgi:hypothetical protein
VLYSHNSFLVAHRIVLTRQTIRDEPFKPYSSLSYHPMFFFLRFLRRDTIRLIRSITFARSCQCGACEFVLR